MNTAGYGSEDLNEHLNVESEDNNRLIDTRASDMEQVSFKQKIEDYIYMI